MVCYKKIPKGDNILRCVLLQWWCDDSVYSNSRDDKISKQQKIKRYATSEAKLKLSLTDSLLSSTFTGWFAMI